MNRRGFMQALGLGALVAPNAISQVNLPTTAAAGWAGGLNQHAALTVAGSVPTWERARIALADKQTLDAVRTSLFEKNRHITFLDPDLASKRSFSLAAKIAFQRQRNVEAELAAMRRDSWSSHTWGIIENFLRRP